MLSINMILTGSLAEIKISRRAKIAEVPTNKMLKCNIKSSIYNMGHNVHNKNNNGLS